MSREPTDGAISVEYVSESDAYRATFDGERTPPSRALLRVIAVLEGTDPRHLDPLYDSIDPGAMDRLCRRYPNGSRADDLVIRFRYRAYEITIRNSGSIEVDPYCDDAE